MILESDTIAAISTPRGPGGIGVIRVSGSNSIKICDKCFKKANGLEEALSKSSSHVVHYGHIVFNEEFIDEVLVSVFKSPRSYTGEDVVEISCHGGLYITRRILEIVVACGARFAEAGEFTKRSFLNGKIDLTEAESVMDIISATGELSAKAAISAKRGILHKKICEIKDVLIDIVASLSVWADYPDEDLESINVNKIRFDLISCKDKLEALLSTYFLNKFLKDGIRVVIVGKPNVGKSTIMNLLVGKEKSIVSTIPGTTRDVIEEPILLGDIYIRIVDTAGIHETDDIVESIGIERAKQQLDIADLVLLVFDNSERLDDNDMALIRLLNDVKTIGIINKIDLDNKLDTAFIEKKLDGIVNFSAIKEQGIDDLEKKVYDLFSLSKFNPSEGILATERQKIAIEKAKKNLETAIEDIDRSVTLDAVTVMIESAVSDLLVLTGEKVSSVVVDRIFSKFCVGK